jgi:hypothetical protein
MYYNLYKLIYFLFQGSIPVPPATVLEELFQKVEGMPNWSPAISYCKIIQVNSTRNLNALLGALHLWEVLKYLRLSETQQ